MSDQPVGGRSDARLPYHRPSIKPIGTVAELTASNTPLTGAFDGDTDYTNS